MAWSGKRILIGCGLGCGTLLLIVVLLGISFGVWLNRPGELLEPERLLGADTTGYFEWSLSLDDPGTEGFVHAVVEKAREMPPELEGAIPPWLGSWLSDRQGRSAERDIRKLLPLVAAWTLRPGVTADDDLHLFSVSLGQIGNRLVLGDWILGLTLRRTDDARIRIHRNEKIYGLPLGKGRHLTFFIRGSDFFITSDVKTAELAVDRLLEAERAPREATGLDLLFSSSHSGEPMRGALTNERGEVVRLWRKLIGSTDGAERLRELRGATIHGGLRTDGSVTGTLELIGPAPSWSEDHAEELIRNLREGLAQLELGLELDGATDGDRIRIDLRIPDLVMLLDRLEEDHSDRSRVRIGH